MSTMWIPFVLMSTAPYFKLAETPMKYQQEVRVVITIHKSTRSDCRVSPQYPTT
jgi:hypothetical protein